MAGGWSSLKVMRTRMGAAKQSGWRQRGGRIRPANPEPSANGKVDGLPEGNNHPEENSHLAAIVRQCNEAVFSGKPDGTIVTWNAAAERIFGFRASEVTGRSWRILMPRGQGDEFDWLKAGIRRGQAIQQFETERLRKDGETIFVSLSLSPLRARNGELIGFSAMARDITVQRRALESVRRSERALSDLFEEASVGLLWTTREGSVLRANQVALDILECPLKHCLGPSLGRYFGESATFASVLQRLIGREAVRNQAATLITRNGLVKEVLIDASAFREGGRVGHLRWFVRDITRRKQLEREVLAISERERGVFARELHDSLGQQLSGVMYLSNVLRTRLGEAGSAEASRAEHISALLRRALDQVRTVARGLSPVRAEPEGLGFALKELAMQTSSVFGISCRFQWRKPVPANDGEAANHLYRIAQEAVHNAVRHGQAKRITIGLDRNGEAVRLRVIDDGKGIRPLSPRRKGLGLRIMQYRAGLLRGTVIVRPRRLGGTEVVCTAPSKVLKGTVPS
jgi:PAS domain S-box-containing protein